MARRGGALSFARYMELALYAPGLGYYSAGSRKLGAEGDFVTAPEVSTLFSACVAHQIADVLATLGGGAVLEVGAGTGAMATSVLAELERTRAPLAGYRILERSAELRARQQATLDTRAHRVRWVQELPAPGFRGVVVANELLDALPAARFAMTPEGVRECCVRWEGDAAQGRFAWLLDRPEHAELASAVRDIETSLGRTLGPGYVSEVGLAQRAWVREMARRIDRGVLLIFDYGYPRAEYYHPQRDRGTLTCFYRHRAHSDPLILTGIQDISVHVDFTAVAEAACAEGLELAGFTTQADFLLATNLLERLESLAPESDAYRALSQQVKRLTLPTDMGELVKVMALAREYPRPLSGFTGRDLSGRL
ncbi:MAG: SAM-dependent methyltransferase [Gammaproteobacteria bacterium]|nr:SAM-dependent methyltransferase [Gammaproteobacteria bacterium]NIR82744.1 SAM-dependent methyltransferase [Gammaproteobacteria bacterium]NIR89608.1 SAM-dependent methyltransferase [Gammaproteobacteria bacterium]NIU03904.1 SAM-dependent methyltransferase [Gammaproteobacteria bacterium]NIV51220.1 SAM-dependent methyltransferase [Gammaproteobacteria bacterium]